MAAEAEAEEEEAEAAEAAEVAGGGGRRDGARKTRTPHGNGGNKVFLKTVPCPVETQRLRRRSMPLGADPTLAEGSGRAKHQVWRRGCTTGGCPEGSLEMG